jgi:hypothetical protein
MSDEHKINHIKQNIQSLQGEMKGLNNTLDLDPTNLFPDDKLIPDINEVEVFDYDKEIMEIRKDSDITLECLSSLYLKAEDIEKKNISNIINNDAESLSDLKFSLSCSKRGLINLMRQLDMGINDPDLYSAVGTFQKEIRDTVKMIYDIQKKMKEFYKDIRDEMNELNKGEESDNIEDVEIDEENEYHIVDLEKIKEQIEEYKKGSK